MHTKLVAACDAVLADTVKDAARVHGVVGMVADSREVLYEGAFGSRSSGSGEPMSEDTVFGIFSCTKALTSTVIMQLVEAGAIDLDAPARSYCPELGDAQVLEGFDLTGEPRLRAPKQEITTRNLLLHTAGFGYDFFNEFYRRFYSKKKLPPVLSGAKAAIRLPLLFDPGERWEYGISMDWAGLVAEAVTGKPLGDLMRERIFDPLEMRDSGFALSTSMRERLAPLHQRGTDGSLNPLSGFTLPNDPEVQMGGHGVYSTVADFMRFIRMLLNEGMGPNGPVLKPETVERMYENGLGELKVRALKNVHSLSGEPFELLPGVPKSWGYSFMLNDEPAPTGRPAGALSWAGMANVYYWVDKQNGIGGCWATQILPFADPASYTGYMAFETAVYDSLV